MNGKKRNEPKQSKWIWGGTNKKTGDDLSIANETVNTLFTNTKEALKTEYQINQAGSLVETLSEQLYSNEKWLLLQAV